MSDGRTHWEGCYKEYGHKDCAIAQIERLTAEVARLKHRENYLFDYSQQNTELQARVDELESALRGYVKATTGQESATVTFPMALEGEVK